MLNKLDFEIAYADLSDKDAWLKLDAHLSEREFEYKVREGRAIILRDGTRPLGVLRFGMFWDMIPFCNLLFIDENFRGRGFGSELLRFWESEMRALGSRVVLTSTQVDESAQHFYRKHGYRDCGGLICDLPGFEQPMELFMVKPL